jgi:serine protease Do
MLRVLALLLILLPLSLRAETVPPDATTIDLTFAPVVKQVAPAVVNIYSASQGANLGLPFSDPILREFFGDEFGPGFGLKDRSSASLGSGVIVSADGLIVTNEHVVKQANEITVILSDGREFAAKVVLDDERTDLAVLRIDPEGEALPTVDFRDSDSLEVGDLVLAIGNPYGVGQTVTLGIVSALARTQVGISDYSFFIQTDAAINPGNSGGALVAADGRLVGINTAIYSQSGGSIGIGFAIPSNMVQTVIAAAENGGVIERPWAGLRGENVTAELAPSLGLSRPGGVVVNELYPGGPADRAGIEPGDVILTVGGQPVLDLKAMNFRLATMGVGKTVPLGLQRRREALTLDLALAPPPEDPPSDPRVLGGHQPLSGATVVNLSPALAEDLGLGDLWQGVMVLKVARGSPARRLGFRPGDLVWGVNGEAIDDTAELEAVIDAATSNVWQLDVERDGHRSSFEVKG